MDELKQAGGVLAVALSLLGTLATLFKVREMRAAKKVEIEANLQQSLLDRLASLELRDASKEKKLEDLATRATLAEQNAARLSWAYDELQKDFAAQGKKLARAEREIRQLQLERDEQRDRAEKLSIELQELYREIAAGHQTVAIRKPKIT